VYCRVARIVYVQNYLNSTKFMLQMNCLVNPSQNRRGVTMSTLTSAAMERTPTSSRPLTPDSPIRNLLLNRDSGFHLDDDLTNSLLALRNFSTRSGETTPLPLTCCCENQDCGHLREWRDAIEKLEKQLVLSAGKPLR